MRQIEMAELMIGVNNFSKTYVEALIAALACWHYDARRAAAEALGRIGGQAAVPALILLAAVAWPAFWIMPNVTFDVYLPAAIWARTSLTRDEMTTPEF